MRILMISNDKRISDPVSESAARMVEYGSLVDKLYILILGYGGEGKDLSDRVKILPTSRNKFFAIFKAVQKGRRIKNINLITTHDPFFSGKVGYLIRRKTGSHLQLQIHTDIMSTYFKAQSWTNRVRFIMANFLIPRADCIRVVSQKVKGSLLKENRFGFNTGQISVLPIFVDVEKIKSAEPKVDLRKKYPNYDKIILMASRFTEEKNIELAIDAMKEIIKEFPRTLLLIVGSGPLEKDLRFKIYDLRIENSIKIESWTDDLISYYKTADIYLLTSNFEGYGMTLMEAAAAGSTIVSTNVGVANEILKKENIFEPGHLRELVDKLKLALADRLSKTEPPPMPDKSEYLEQYKKSWQQCGY